MMAIKKYLLQFRYEKGDHWITYDETRVSSWAESQFEQMKKDHPGAEYRKMERK